MTLKRWLAGISGGMLFANIMLLLMFITAFDDWGLIWLIILLDTSAMLFGAGIILVISTIKEYNANKRTFDIKERFSRNKNEAEK